MFEKTSLGCSEVCKNCKHWQSFCLAFPYIGSCKNLRIKTYQLERCCYFEQVFEEQHDNQFRNNRPNLTANQCAESPGRK